MTERRDSRQGDDERGSSRYSGARQTGAGQDRSEELMRAFGRFHRREMMLRTPSVAFKVSEGRALHMLREAGTEGMKVSELSQKMRVSSPFATQLLNQLEERGMIVRQKSNKDRRSVLVTLTPAGMRSADEVRGRVYDLYSSLAGHLGEEKSALLSSLLHQAFDYLEANQCRLHEPDAPPRNMQQNRTSQE